MKKNNKQKKDIKKLFQLIKIYYFNFKKNNNKMMINLLAHNKNLNKLQIFNKINKIKYMMIIPQQQKKI